MDASTTNTQAMEPSPIRELTADDVERANEVYDSLDFVRSIPPAYRTFGSFAGERLIALSRVVTSDDGGIELGGIWTHADARGGGLARRMVEHILSSVPSERTCYLVAFEHLADFYRSCGFSDPPPEHEAPDSVIGKRSLCSQLEVDGRPASTVLLWRPGLSETP